MENDFKKIKQFAETGLPTSHIGRKIIALDTVESTNRITRQWIQERRIFEGQVVIADEQTFGRGRLERSWHSPPGEGIWMSVVIKPRVDIKHWYWYTLLSAVAVARTIEETTGIQPELKWPNDVMINGKKCCGILIESVPVGDRTLLVMGLGLNINQSGFPDELKERAISLSMVTGRLWSRLDIFKVMLTHFNDLIKEVSTDIIALWKQRVRFWGEPVLVIEAGQSYEAIAEDIDEDGGLIITREGQKTKLYAGDVILRVQRG